MTGAEKTEPAYFKSFPINREKALLEVRGIGRNTESLVKWATKKRKDMGYINTDDHVWVVFDKDDYKDQQFNNAVQYANKKELETAWSNEAFELWLLLHFQNLTSRLARNQYNIALSKHLLEPYDKSLSYETLSPLQENAIQRAQALEKESEDTSPARQNPMTRVHHLVTFLNDLS